MATFKVKTIGTQWDSAQELEITGEQVTSTDGGRIVEIRRPQGTSSRTVFLAPVERIAYVQRVKE